MIFRRDPETCRRIALTTAVLLIGYGSVGVIFWLRSYFGPMFICLPGLAVIGILADVNSGGSIITCPLPVSVFFSLLVFLSVFLLILAWWPFVLFVVSGGDREWRIRKCWLMLACDAVSHVVLFVQVACHRGIGEFSFSEIGSVVGLLLRLLVWRLVFLRARYEVPR